MRKSIAWMAAFAVLGFICGGPGIVSSAEAKPKPGPNITTKYYRPVPRLTNTIPNTVWVSAEPGLGSYAGVYASGYWNPRTGVTDFVGQLTPDGLGWAHTACPQAARLVNRPPCLRVVWGNLAEGVYGKYQSVYCAGGCTRQGLITVNRWGPYFCATDPSCPYEPTYGSSNPWNHGTILTHYFGRFLGLAAHPTRDCTSVMSERAWTCAPPRADDPWLTPAEATYAAGW